MDRYVVEGEVSYLSFLTQKWKLRVVKELDCLPCSVFPHGFTIYVF